MKKVIRLLFILVLVLPIFVKAGTYTNEVNNANDLIKQEFYINTYEKYILQGKKIKYEYSNSKVIYNKSFIRGGFISKDEYDLTVSLGDKGSYLLDSEGYWTLTKDGKNVYVIKKNEVNISKDVNSDYGARVTEYVKPKTVVSGSGTESDPWQFDPMYKVSVTVNSQYAKIESGNNEYVKGNCTTKECTSEIKITGSKGYRYISNDCNGVYNIKTQVLTINNVKRNLECNVEFGYGLFTINITDAKPTTFYAIYADDFYSDVDNKTVLKSLTSVVNKKGHTFMGFSYDGVLIIDKNKNLVKNSLNSISKDLTLDPIFEPNKYTVQYNCNGGFGAPKNQSITYGQKYNLTKDLCKREGYIQDGWNVQKDGKGYGWNEGNRTDWTWKIDYNVTLYAMWKKCEGGTYSSAESNTCEKCKEGTYSDEGSGKCSACPKGYASDEGASSIESCYITVEAGKYIKDPKSNKQIECPDGYYATEQKVGYGKESKCTKCPIGYADGDKLENKTEKKACVRKVSAGYYIANSEATGNTVCENGYYKEEHEVKYGSKSSCDLCPAGYRDGSKIENKTAQDKCLRNVAAGYYIATPKSVNNTLCPNGQYSTTHSIVFGEVSKCTWCPEGYRDGRKLDNKTSKNTCIKNVPAGHYVATEKSEDNRICSNGFYKESHSLKYGETSKCDICPEGYRDGVTVSNKTEKNKCLRTVNSGYYVAKAHDVSNTLCPDGYYREKHGVTYGAISSCSQCPAGYRDGKSAVNKSGKDACTRLVEAGYYVANANDTMNTGCEKGKYKSTHTVTYGQTSTCNNCPEGYRDGTTLESKTSESKCVRNVPAGYYIMGSKATNNTECATGYFKSAHSVTYGGISRCEVCPSGYRNGTTVANKVSKETCIRNVSQNHFIAKSGDDRDTACPSGTTKEAHTVTFGNTSTCR